MGAEPKSTEKASVINSFVRSSITGLVGLLGGAVEAVRKAEMECRAKEDKEEKEEDECVEGRKDKTSVIQYRCTLLCMFKHLTQPHAQDTMPELLCTMNSMNVLVIMDFLQLCNDITVAYLMISLI